MKVRDVPHGNAKVHFFALPTNGLWSPFCIFIYDVVLIFNA